MTNGNWHLLNEFVAVTLRVIGKKSLLIGIFP